MDGFGEAYFVFLELCYKHLEIFKCLIFLQIQLEYFTDGTSELYYLFNKNSEDKEAWFAKEQLTSSSYSDIEDIVKVTFRYVCNLILSGQIPQSEYIPWMN